MSGKRKFVVLVITIAAIVGALYAVQPQLFQGSLGVVLPDRVSELAEERSGEPTDDDGANSGSPAEDQETADYSTVDSGLDRDVRKLGDFLVIEDEEEEEDFISDSQRDRLDYLADQRDDEQIDAVTGLDRPEGDTDETSDTDTFPAYEYEWGYVTVDTSEEGSSTGLSINPSDLDTFTSEDLRNNPERAFDVYGDGFTFDPETLLLTNDIRITAPASINRNSDRFHPIDPMEVVPMTTSEWSEQGVDAVATSMPRIDINFPTSEESKVNLYILHASADLTAESYLPDSVKLFRTFDATSSLKLRWNFNNCAEEGVTLARRHYRCATGDYVLLVRNDLGSQGYHYFSISDETVPPEDFEPRLKLSVSTRGSETIEALTGTLQVANQKYCKDRRTTLSPTQAIYQHTDCKNMNIKITPTNFDYTSMVVRITEPATIGRKTVASYEFEDAKEGHIERITWDTLTCGRYSSGNKVANEECTKDKVYQVDVSIRYLDPLTGTTKTHTQMKEFYVKAN